MRATRDLPLTLPLQRLTRVARNPIASAAVWVFFSAFAFWLSVFFFYNPINREPIEVSEMIERILQTHTQFLRCASCARQPLHVVSHGWTSNEPLMQRGSTERHRLECPACARSTGRHNSLTHAEAEWGEKWAQLPLGLLTAQPEDGAERGSETAVDEQAVRATVAAHACAIGCTDSNITAACNYGLKVGHYTLACVRIGKKRAEKLRNQQPDHPGPKGGQNDIYKKHSAV